MEPAAPHCTAPTLPLHLHPNYSASFLTIGNMQQNMLQLVVPLRPCCQSCNAHTSERAILAQTSEHDQYVGDRNEKSKEGQCCQNYCTAHTSQRVILPHTPEHFLQANPLKRRHAENDDKNITTKSKERDNIDTVSHNPIKNEKSTETDSQQNQKKMKKVKRVTIIEYEDENSESGSDSKGKSRDIFTDEASNQDLSFLDDLDCDEIVSCLKKCDSDRSEQETKYDSTATLKTSIKEEPHDVVIIESDEETANVVDLTDEAECVIENIPEKKNNPVNVDLTYDDEVNPSSSSHELISKVETYPKIEKNSDDVESHASRSSHQIKKRAALVEEPSISRNGKETIPSISSHKVLKHVFVEPEENPNIEVNSEDDEVIPSAYCSSDKIQKSIFAIDKGDPNIPMNRKEDEIPTSSSQNSLFALIKELNRRENESTPSSPSHQTRRRLVDVENKTPNIPKNPEEIESNTSSSLDNSHSGVEENANNARQTENSESTSDSEDEKHPTTLQSETTLEEMLPPDKFMAKQLAKNLTDSLKENFFVTDLIAKGKFSKIYKCYSSDKHSKKKYAVKLALDKSDFGNLKQNMITKILQEKPKVAQFFVGVKNGFKLAKHWLFLMEYLPKSLAQELQENKPLHIDRVQKLTQQLVTAVTVLRDNQIVHSDIKPGHILLNANGNSLKLCGFDAAVYFNENQTRIFKPNVGTASYRAPETIMGYPGGFSIDVWATGLVMYEMATGQKLIQATDDNNDILNEQMSILGNMPREMIASSRYADKHFKNQQFVWIHGPDVKKPTVIPDFPRTNKIEKSLIGAYNRHWNRRRFPERDDDMTMLNKLESLLHKVLVIHPGERLTIGSVYSNRFIHSW